MEAAKVGDDSSFGSDEILGDIWDWCPLKGCRPVTYAGKIYLKKGPYEKYRYVPFLSPRLDTNQPDSDMSS
jgi:hypothetical protein